MNPTTAKSRLGDMKTIAQQLNVTEFPFIVRDTNGKPIYWETSEKYWIKWEYDSNGNEILFEDSDGLWTKREYDCNGYQTYLENSKGFWVKRERGPKGALFYYEDSNGLVINNRRTPHSGKVVEIDGIKYKLTAV
jgi:hypothetical protein